MTDNQPLRGLRILVSGAGVAGPALAHWLGRYGADTTVVELAPALRTAGFAVDFRGDTHLGLLAKMGILDELQSMRTEGGVITCVDERGKRVFQLPAEFAGGDIEVLRGDLSRILYEHSAPSANYIFGDTITELTETTDGVQVEFASSPSRRFDLVIGADGVHSTVRRLAFGAEREFVRHLGFYLAGWEMPNILGVGTESSQYNVPGRMASVAADHRDPERAGAFLVFASPPIDYDRQDIDQQKKIIAEEYRDLGWRVPELLATLPDADELYFDSISRVRAPRWYDGRVALLGDAAWGVTLGGMGVGTGIVGAYVLAGELARARGDHRVAFPAFEKHLRAYAGKWQKSASPGQFLAPTTATRLRVRNAMFKSRFVKWLLLASTKSFATDREIPTYD